MPIRLNLLAEEQHLAEMRRRDPVKRSAWLGGFFLFLMLLWWGMVLLHQHEAKSRLAAQEADFTRIEKAAKEVGDQIKKAGEIEKNIHALNRMGTNRVLWSGCLNALQTCTVENVQVTRIIVRQDYVQTAAVLSKERGKSKPATAAERIVLLISARDYGRTEDENANKFKEKVLQHPWFKPYLAKDAPITFKGFSDPTPDKDDPAKVFVTFTMECTFTEQTRL